ncbi:MAG: 3-deoxy-D-manno-octulosonic acid transferase [Thermodesulfobacteriota bacterium]
MIVIYNIIQLFILIILSPLFFVIVIFNEKYRSRILRRLGFGFSALVRNLPAGPCRIWLHALSVGEVASVRSLVKKIRQERPEVVILFSCTTASGEDYARTSLKGDVDLVFTFPLDFFWLVRRYIRSISPDLFMLVETDFWPNFLFSLKGNKVPALLVNGRASFRSHRFYRYFRFVFLPLLMAFDYLAVQRRPDRENMIGIGVPPEKVIMPGNLKYDGFIEDGLEVGQGLGRVDLFIPGEALVMVAGSTHSGEEKMIFDFIQELSEDFPDLKLIIAPRNIGSCRDVMKMAREYGFPCRLKTEPPPDAHEIRVLVLDTIGELAGVYRLADLVFIGGSLVKEGGHNPLEPAALGKPVLFGPYMDDFCDISTEMIEEGCAVQVDSWDGLIRRGRSLLGDPFLRADLGRRALDFVTERRGAVDNYYRVIETLLRTP